MSMENPKNLSVEKSCKAIKLNSVAKQIENYLNKNY